MVELQQARVDFFSALKEQHVLCVDSKGVASNADSGQNASKEIALSMANSLGAPTIDAKLDGQSSGDRFEKTCADYVQRTFGLLSHLRPGAWSVLHVRSRDKLVIADYEQYAHLAELATLARANPALAAALGSDYAISPDVIVVRDTEVDSVINAPSPLVDGTVSRLASIRRSNGGKPTLHASISCKWTLRSDRAQNARSEALNLVKNRKGRLPHIVAITGEPMPSRIASLALGTGEIDCVYHFALYELKQALVDLGKDDALDMLEIMTTGRRLKDISDLPLDLAT